MTEPLEKARDVWFESYKNELRQNIFSLERIIELMEELDLLTKERDEWKNKYLMKISEVTK